jgi:hypothetical protein
MRPIDKFILHVVHNLSPLFEYDQKQTDILINHYKQEADDLNINITDNQLKAYIKRFDQLKSGIISKGGTDLLKKVSKQIPVTTPDGETVTRMKNDYEVVVPLSQLIKTVTTSKGAETQGDEDKTPDVVYQDNGITIWNGTKESNCINYGRGESWCITRTSWADHRYDEGRGYPTFYLAKNSNLPDSDRLSFVVIAVLDPSIANENKQYVLHNRDNSPHYPPPTTFDNVLNQAPWLKTIPDIKNVLKYIPLSTSEKTSQVYKNKAATVREWINFPFEGKKQYLVVRKGSGHSGRQFFSDISNDTFVEKYLSKYPQIATFIATTAGLLPSLTLIQNLDKFSNQDVKSIISNMRDKINIENLPSDAIPFEVKKFLVKFDKWDLNTSDTAGNRLYVTKDGSTIVRLKLGDDISIGLYQAEDDYPKVKLNKRTSKYLLDYPELDKIPIRNLIKLVQDEIIDKDVLDKILEQAKTNPDSAIVVRGNIIVDSNSFASYKITDDKIEKLPFDNEEVQAIFNEQKENEGFQQNALALIDERTPIPETIDKDAFISILRATPLENRIIEYGTGACVVLTTQSPEHPIVVQNNNRGADSFQITAWYGDNGNWRRKGGSGGFSDDPEIYRSIFTYLRQQGITYSDQQLINNFNSVSRAYNPRGVIKAIVEANIPMTDGSVYKPVIYEGKPYIVNTQNPRLSYGASDNTGKLVKVNIPSALAARMLGNAAPPAIAQAATAAGRRGRPAGQPNAPQTPAAPVAPGEINVREVMSDTGLETAFLRLPRIILRKLNRTNASRVDPNGDRGAARRNNQLGDRGRVGRIIQVGGSKIYFISLPGARIVASINVQPGNSNYLLVGNDGGNVAISLNSPSDLVQALQQRGLAEHRSYIMNEYLSNYPEHKDEVKNILKKHLNK